MRVSDSAADEPLHEMWKDPVFGPWQVIPMFGELAGREEIVGLTIRSAFDPDDSDDDWASELLPPARGERDRDPLPITTEVLRGALAPALARLLARHDEDQAPSLVISATAAPDDAPVFDEPEFAEGSAEHVAEIYLRAHREERSPTLAVKEELGLKSHDAAAARVRRARAKGLLPPTRRGTASGAAPIKDAD